MIVAVGLKEVLSSSITTSENVTVGVVSSTGAYRVSQNFFATFLRILLVDKAVANHTKSYGHRNK